MTKTFPIAPLCGAALCVLALPAQAQNSAIEASWRSDEIVVIGQRAGYGADAAGVTRTPTPLLDWPQAVSVLTSTLLEEQELRTLTDALRNVSGLVPQDPAETVLANPIVRGFEAEIFVDGLIAYGDTAVIDPSSLVGVERVEVAKGPTAALFGGGTGAPVGGLINLVTKTPARDRFAEVGLRVGGFGWAAPWVDVNLPVTGRAALRIAAEYSKGDDAIDAVTTERITAHPSVALALTGATDLVLKGQYSRIEQLEYSGIPTAAARLPGVDPFQFTSAPDAPETVIENAMLTAELTHRFSGALSGMVRARRYESSFREYASFPFLAFFPLEGAEAAIIKGQLPVDIEETTLDASLLWRGRGFGFDQTILVGATLDSVDYRGGTGFDFSPIGVIDYRVGPSGLQFGPAPPVGAIQTNDYRTVALYLQNEIKLADFSVLLSGRASRYALEEVSQPAGGAAVPQSDEAYSEFDPRIGVSYRVREGLSLFAGYATGSRLTIFFSGDQGQPPKPQTSESLEAGVKLDLNAAGLSGAIAAFQITRADLPVASSITPFASVQGGEQKSEGVEADLVWEPSPRLSVLAAFAYTDAVISRDAASGAASARGLRLARTPETSGRLAGRYRFLGGALGGLGLGVGATYAGKAPTTDANAAFSDSYVVLDAQASYDWDRFRLGLSILNLTDEDYLIPYQYLGQDVVRPGRPLSAYVSLSARF